jgi:hypothetical protein
MSVTTVDDEVLDALLKVASEVIYWYCECLNPDMEDEELVVEAAIDAARLVRASQELSALHEWVDKLLPPARAGSPPAPTQAFSAAEPNPTQKGT